MRAKERGSTVSFIVVGVVLAALLMGGIYYVKSRTDTGVVAAGDTSSTSGDDTQSKDTSTAGDSATAPAQTSDSTDTDAATSSTSQSGAGDSGAATTDSNTSSTNATSGTTSSGATSGSTIPKTGVDVAELPKTGAHPFAAILPLGIVAAVVVAYRRSERAKA